MVKSCRRSRGGTALLEVHAIVQTAPKPAAPASGLPPIEVASKVLAILFGPPGARAFAVRLWDGSVEVPRAVAPRFTLVLRRPGALRRMLLPPSELALGEAYLRDDFDIEGDIEAATGLGEVFARGLLSPTQLVGLTALLLKLPADDLPPEVDRHGRDRAHLFGAPHSRLRDTAAVRFHYDTGNDFFALWLDPRMLYTCAYFRTGTEPLDAAQEAKLELICRKLRLRPGERLLDIGCGWGGLVQYAAKHYGVRATGITLSEAQAHLARQRLAAARAVPHRSVRLSPAPTRPHLRQAHQRGHV